MSRALLAVLVAVLAGACAAPDPAGQPADATVTEQVRRVGSILDYIAADYAVAVEDGRIVNQLEYDEQLVFLDDVARLAAELPPTGADLDLAGAIAAIRAQVEARAPPGDVAEAARALRKQVMDGYGVVVAPSATPSLEQGRELYAVQCASCHAADGAADTPIAGELDPAPPSFLDPDTMAGLSPVRAFNAITDGVEGTAMASSAFLSPSERWSLAFFVFTLRHDAGAIDRGRESFRRAGQAVAPTPTRLANLRDEEIAARLQTAGLSAEQSADALAYVRAEATFERSGAPMDTSRQHLAAAVEAYRGGDASGARRSAGAAYLDGFEPHEASLSAVDADLVINLEQQFLALREAIGGGVPTAEVEQRALRIGTVLDSADEILAGETGNRVAFVSSLAILLREGLEGALLILLLLGIARRSGAAEADTRAVHAGWLAAVGLGVVTWFVSGRLLAHIGGVSRELIEGVVALIAAGVLLAVSHFVLARLDAARRVAALKDKLAAAASSPRRRLILASLGFVAVYREAFETVLFLRAIMLDAATSGWAVAAGAGAGIVILIAVVFAMAKLGKRLRPAPLLTALGLLLCVLAVALAGSGVRALQEAGVVGITPIAGPRLDWIGLYPTAQTVMAQVVVLAAFLVLAGWALLRSRAAAQAARAPA
jgi:high-affinity iron transporter